MKNSLLKLLTILFLASFISSSLPAFGQVPDVNVETSSEEQDDPAVARVARLSFIDGDVSFLRAQVTEWADAAENLPLLAGDQIYTGAGARAEIQLGRGAYLRLSEKTALTISELSETAAQFEVTEGVAVIRVDKLSAAFTRFEVDTPNSALVLEKGGLYRINVKGDEESEVIVRLGAADVTTADGTFKVREGNRLIVDTSSTGRLEIAADTSMDDWDRWSYDRDSSIDASITAASPDYVDQYESDYDSFYGASELSNYGTWTTVSSYGNCWVPRVSSGWAPYRDGQWLWVPALGWTWLSNEPWGWAPYHYGRWIHAGRLGWVWSPGFRSHYAYGPSYYRWRPALVAFFHCPTPRGNYVGWYPLAPGERWRRADHRRRDRDHSHLQYPSAPRNGGRRADDSRTWRRPDRADGVTLQPVSGFARADKNRVRPAAPPRDIEEFIRNGARPGLPEVPASDLASAPAWRRGQDLSNRPSAIRPSAEVLKRPVVTSLQPVNPVVRSSAPRERRVLIPRKPIEAAEWARRNRDRAQSEAATSGGMIRPPRGNAGDEKPDAKIRPARPPVPGSQSESAASSDGKREPGEADSNRNRRSSEDREKNKSAGNDAQSRPRHDLSPAVGQREPKERPDTSRESRPPATERKRAREERPRPEPDTSSRPRQDGGSSDSNKETRRERPPAPSAERSQERHEQRQQKQEPRQENAERPQRKKN